LCIFLTDSTEVVIVDADDRFSVDTLVDDAGGKIGSQQAWVRAVECLMQLDFRSPLVGSVKCESYRDDQGIESITHRDIGVLDFLEHAGIVKLMGFDIGMNHIQSDFGAGIVLVAALLLFVPPSGDREQPRLMVWEDIIRLPWGVLILFGGGLSLAAAVSDSGLALWLGQQLAPLNAWGIAVLVLASVTLVIFLTELTSNLATTATLLPVMGAIAVQAGLPPIILTVPITIAASCAFMLPVATPPNAIVFSTGSISIPQMARAGIVLNLIGIVIVTLISLYVAPAALR